MIVGKATWPSRCSTRSTGSSSFVLRRPAMLATSSQKRIEGNFVVPLAGMMGMVCLKIGVDASNGAQLESSQSFGSSF